MEVGRLHKCVFLGSTDAALEEPCPCLMRQCARDAVTCISVPRPAFFFFFYNLCRCGIDSGRFTPTRAILVRIKRNRRNRPIRYRPKFKVKKKKKKGAKRTISTQTKPSKPKTLSHLWIICSAPLYLSALSCLRLPSLLWAIYLPSLSQTHHPPLSYHFNWINLSFEPLKSRSQFQLKLQNVHLVSTPNSQAHRPKSPNSQLRYQSFLLEQWLSHFFLGVSMFDPTCEHDTNLTRVFSG